MPLKNSLAFMICVYKNDNVDHFRESLDSIYSQELPPETSLHVYLHIDGVISDECENLIARYPIYKILRSEKNVGLAKGLNKIIKSLEGELLIFRMDADDICLPNRVIQQVQFMDSNPSLDLSGGSIYEFINDSNFYTMERNYPVGTAEIIDTLVKGSPFAHVTVCFRGDFFERFSTYPTNFPLNEDIGLWYECLRLGAVADNLQDKLVKVRMESAYSRRGFKKSIYEFSVYWKICSWLGKGYYFPIFRLLFRFLPKRIVEFIYNSSIRTNLFRK